LINLIISPVVFYASQQVGQADRRGFRSQARSIPGGRLPLRYSPEVHLLTKHEKIRIIIYHFVNINVWGIKAKNRSDLDNPN